MSETKSEFYPNFKAAIFRYLIAFWTVGIAFMATLLLSPLMQPGVSPLFLLAVMISAWRGGLSVGLLATFLAAFANVFIFLPPKYSLDIDHNDWLQMIVFSFAAVVIGSLSASRKTAEEAKQLALVKEQSARIEAEKANAVKDEFLAAVSHELRTPLTTIKTLTRVMQRRELAREEQSEYLKDIASECDRQIEFVQTLLDLSRIESGAYKIEYQPVDVIRLLGEIAEEFRGAIKARNLKLELILPDASVPVIITDSKALRQIVRSTIENAMKYTPEGGDIRISLESRNEQLVIFVADNGCGIAAADLPHIFDRFYRGRPLGNSSEIEEFNETPGVGLGLFLVAALVNEIGAQISVVSPVPDTYNGTEFSISLPLNPSGMIGKKLVSKLKTN